MKDQIELPASAWSVRPLGEAISIVMGQAPAGRDCNKTGQGTPFVKAGEFGEMRPIIREWTTDPKKLGKRSDVFVCVVGATCGKINLGEDCAIGRSVAALRPKPEVLDQFYLHYYLHGTVEKLRSGSLGSAQTVISKNMLAELPIPLPPLEEQKRIVAVLDQAFAALDRARAHAEANLADAGELLENGVNEVFTELAATAPITKLSDAVHPECKLSYGIVQPGDEVDGGIPVVRPVNLKQRIVTLDGLKRISPDRADGYARTKLVGGEILLCVRGSTGEMSVASEDLMGANVTRGIVPIRFPSEKVIPEFAYFQLRSRYAQDQIAAGTYGAALMQINIKDLRKLSFIVPALKVQQDAIFRVEHLYERTERLCAAYAKKLTHVHDLRQSLLQRAFSGQLT